MKINEVLEQLEKLLKSWGINTADWILVANYAYRLLGYEVKLRPGHLNVLVKRSKIPWKIKEGIEIHPPRDTKFRDDFRKFIEKTGFDFDINLATHEEFKKKKGKYITYTLPNGRRIRLQTPVGAIKEFEKLLVLSTKDGLGVERLKKDIGNIEDMIKVLKRRGEKGTEASFQKLLVKYEQAKRKSLGKKPLEEGYISGIVASSGKVTGKVAVVRDLEDAIRLSTGDVLVTEMTSTKFTEVLPKISAIVTDWGGKLSHAAILAREMEVPCIVGTQIATKVLKDGDLVEVDATRGIVRKLNTK